MSGSGCYGCDALYHCDCLDLPATAPPAGEWYCPQCESQHHAPAEALGLGGACFSKPCDECHTVRGNV